MRYLSCLWVVCLGSLVGCDAGVIELPASSAGEPAAPAVVSAGPALSKDAPMDKEPEIRVIESEDEFNKLTAEEKRVILRKGTERAFVGQFTDTETKGTYICRRCNAALYRSDSKFHSGCGWPSFDDEIEGSVTRVPDIDGFRTEIVCSNCEGHLGHVFLGERFTSKDTRHCVNSISMKFARDGQKLPPKLVLRSKLEAEAAEEKAQDE